MWPVRYDSSLWIRTHSLSNKVSFRQISQDGVCSGSTSENRISHPPLSDPRGTGLVRLCLQPLVLPPRGCSLFFKHKRVFLTDPPWIVATWVLHNELLQRVPECDCASNKKNEKNSVVTQWAGDEDTGHHRRYISDGERHLPAAALKDVAVWQSSASRVFENKKKEDTVCERNATPPPIILSFVVLFSSGLFLCSFLFFVVTGGITHSLNTNLSCLELTWAYYAVSVALLSSFSVDLKSRLHVYSTGLCCSTYSSRVRSLLKDKFAPKKSEFNAFKHLK